MHAAPLVPPVIAEEMPPADGNRAIQRLPQIMLALWTLSWLYACIVFGVELVEMEYYPQKVTITDHRTELFHVENSANISARLPEQFTFIDVVHLYNDSWNGVHMSLDSDQEEGTFNEVAPADTYVDGTPTSLGFIVADKEKTATLSISSNDEVLYMSEPEISNNGDSTSFTSDATTIDAVDGFQNELCTSKITTAEEASTDSVAAHRTNFAGSTPVAARLPSAPEEVKSQKRRSAVSLKVKVD